MKNRIFTAVSVILVLLACTSCSSYKLQTVSSVGITKDVIDVERLMAKLDVDLSKKITGKSDFCQTKTIAMKEAEKRAIQAANADVIVDPTFEIFVDPSKKNPFQATVVGYGAKYKEIIPAKEAAKELENVDEKEIQKYLLLNSRSYANTFFGGNGSTTAYKGVNVGTPTVNPQYEKEIRSAKSLIKAGKATLIAGSPFVFTGIVCMGVSASSKKYSSIVSDPVGAAGIATFAIGAASMITGAICLPVGNAKFKDAEGKEYSLTYGFTGNGAGVGMTF